MGQTELSGRHHASAEEFNQHENREDGAQVVASLDEGLTVLRDALYVRVSVDVEQSVGIDSMLMPLSAGKTEESTKVEIETYQIAESADAVMKYGYVASTESDWYTDWLRRLRLGEKEADPSTVDQLARYRAEPPDNRRLAFTDILARVLPESMRAPLVLFRLYPLSVSIVTATAFHDQTTARGLRGRQSNDLPAVTYCRQCKGRVLDNGEYCTECGNPLWTYQWLTATD